MAICCRIFVVLTALIAVLATSVRPADACINVSYKGLKPNSKERKAIVRAMVAKDWKKAKRLLVAARAKAHAKRDKVHTHASLVWDAEGWHHIQLARAHYHLGEIDAAREEIDATRFSYSGTRKAQREVRVDYALVKSAIDARQGKLADAIETLEKGIKAFPKEARMHAQLGTFHEKNSDTLAAHAALAEAVRLSPKHHGGMEWTHLEVVRYRIQLAFYPGSHATHPLRDRLATRLEGKKLDRALAFAANLAPDLPLRN